MSREPPSGDESDDVDDLYRRASAFDASRPSDSARTRVLAHAARLAEEHARSGPAHKRTASRIHWRPAVFGTLAAAAVAGLMVLPRFFPLSSPPVSEAALKAVPHAPPPPTPPSRAAQQFAPPPPPSAQPSPQLVPPPPSAQP